MNEKVPGTIKALKKHLDSETAENYSKEMSSIAEENQILFIDILEFFNDYVKNEMNIHDKNFRDRVDSQGDFIHEENSDKMGQYQIFRTPVNTEFAHLFIDPGHPNEVGERLIANQIEPVIEGLIHNP